jgi:hypothetical protein
VIPRVGMGSSIVECVEVISSLPSVRIVMQFDLKDAQSTMENWS